jgi:hypothetical protein
MKVTFSPARLDQQLELTKLGDILTDGDGLALDFSQLPNGATLPGVAIDCWWIAGDVTRSDAGVLTVPVVLPNGPTALEAARFPADIGNVPNGKVSLPPYNAPEPEPEPEEEPA